ncbi:MAG: phosphodiester glycosidase family protein [Clostridia bacterium]|nr:phosphodiester glycosidase family protein [Clostridia bacterium]
MKKHRKVFRNLLIDLLCTGLALLVFALFHHVLPRQQQSLGIVIANPYQVDSAEDGKDAGFNLPDDAMLIASAGVSDSTTLSGRGGKQNNGSRNGKNGMNSKGGSALTEEDAGEAGEEEEDDTPISEKFADHYTGTVEVTENSYSSPDISITVTEETLGRATYYLADIYVRDITCFRSALAQNTYGSGFRDSIEDMAALSDALLAINGDYYGNTNEGVVIRNGVIYRANPTNCDVCVLYYDGTMRVMPGSSFTVEEAVAQGAWQAWTFGPALLDLDGGVLTSFSSTGRIISENPRTAIGYYEPGHYCMVVVDGRGESAGISLPDLSQLFYDLGCRAAYNLDGGNSSIMVWNNEIINAPSGGGRESSDALLIAEVRSNE